MWWDWLKGSLKPSRLYLGHGLVLAAPAGAAVQAIPVEGGGLAGALAAAAPCFRRGERLRIDLGPQQCMAVPVSYPQGLRGFAERHQVAHAVCAGALGLPPEQTCCEIDAQRPAVAAATAAADLAAIREWALAGGLHVVSIRPLWSVVGEHARPGPGKALVVVEPGGTTVLGQRLESGSWAGFSLAHATGQEDEAPWLQMLDAAHLAPDGCRVVRLTGTASAQVTKLPLPWQGYLQGEA